MVGGDFAAAVPALRSGRGVLVSENLAFLERIRPGDMLPVPTPAGPRAMRVEGVFVDYLGSLDQGAIAVSTEQMAALWGDRSANLYRLWLRPGTDASTVRTAVLRRLGAGYYAITSRQFLEAVRAVLDTLFAATWALVAVAGIVSVIGVVNVQLATVLDRAAEIGMLRTIGVTRGDVVWSVLIECGTLGLLGGTLGFVLGGLLSAQFVTISLRRVTGWRMAYELPVGPLLGVVAAAGLVSAMAGWVPAWAAARSEAHQRSVD
jgi:putative ABC transport system permease protein